MTVIAHAITASGRFSHLDYHTPSSRGYLQSGPIAAGETKEHETKYTCGQQDGGEIYFGKKASLDEVMSSPQSWISYSSWWTSLSERSKNISSLCNQIIIAPSPNRHSVMCSDKRNDKRVFPFIVARSCSSKGVVSNEPLSHVPMSHQSQVPEVWIRLKPPSALHETLDR